MMKFSRVDAALLAGAACLLAADFAAAQSTYPARNITLLVPLPPEP